jgi:hypothetical protein
VSQGPPPAPGAGGAPPEYTEEELRALEAEMERVTVDDVLLQTIISLLNLAARKGGLTAPPGEGPEPDWEQLRQGIEGARALMPLVEPRHGPQLGSIRDALSRLQVHYARNAPAGQGPPADAPGGPASTPPGPGGAGAAPPVATPPPSRLWIPGQ